MLLGGGRFPPYSPHFGEVFYIFLRKIRYQEQSYWLTLLAMLSNISDVGYDIGTQIPIIGEDLAPKKVCLRREPPAPSKTRTLASCAKLKLGTLEREAHRAQNILVSGTLPPEMPRLFARYTRFFASVLRGF